MHRLFLLLLLVVESSSLLADSNLQVVTSIRPLQLITNQIMLGVGEAQQLTDNTQSPHHFQLKPSQLKLLQHSDVLIWISDEFETGLARLRDILPNTTETLVLSQHLPHELLIEQHHAADHHEIDGHLWLSPDLIPHLAQLIADTLSNSDPQHRTLYQQNKQSLVKQVYQWQQQQHQHWQHQKPRYILDHAFLGYFERGFGLSNQGYLRDNHDQGLSIKQLSQLHQRLQQQPVSCLLLSDLPAHRLAQQLSDQYQLKLKFVDTLGSDGQAINIVQLLQSISEALENCR